MISELYSFGDRVAIVCMNISIYDSNPFYIKKITVCSNENLCSNIMDTNILLVSRTMT